MQSSKDYVRRIDDEDLNDDGDLIHLPSSNGETSSSSLKVLQCFLLVTDFLSQTLYSNVPNLLFPDEIGEIWGYKHVNTFRRGNPTQRKHLFNPHPYLKQNKMNQAKGVKTSIFEIFNLYSRESCSYLCFIRKRLNLLMFVHTFEMQKQKVSPEPPSNPTDFLTSTSTSDSSINKGRIYVSPLFVDVLQGHPFTSLGSKISSFSNENCSRGSIKSAIFFF